MGAKAKAEDVQNGRDRIPALRNKMKAPLAKMPCRMPCDRLDFVMMRGA